MNSNCKKLFENKGIYRENESLARHTTLKAGGSTAGFFEPADEAAFLNAIEYCKENGIPWIVLGNGSNVLFSDDHFDGLVLSTRKLNKIVRKDNQLEAEAGASLIALSFLAQQNGLTGLEFASGIPGSVGGGLYMNAGAYKKSLSDILDQVKVYRNGKVEWISGKELDYGYRHSSFQKHPDWIVLGGRFNLDPSDPAEILDLMERRKVRRESTQPVHEPSAGSVFRNPEQMPAWQIVDGLGFRGKSVGGAKVSELHSNFIVNQGNATGKDISELIDEIIVRAKEKYGIDLVCEVERIDLSENPKKV